jgi:exonuclease III
VIIAKLELRRLHVSSVSEEKPPGGQHQSALRLPGDPADTQSRYIEAPVNGVFIASIYVPNGNP